MATPKPPTVPKALSDIMLGTRDNDPEREAKGCCDLAEAKIAEAIQRNLAKAPELTTAQITRLSALLRGGARSGAPVVPLPPAVIHKRAGGTR